MNKKYLILSLMLLLMAGFCFGGATPTLDILLNGNFTDVLGPELVNNGNFSSLDAGTPIFTGWSNSATTGNSEVQSVDEGQLHGGTSGSTFAANLWTDNSTDTTLSQNSILEVGETYLATFELTFGTGQLSFRNFSTGTTYAQFTTSGNKSVIFVATDAGIAFKRDDSINVTVDNVSIRKALSPWIPGDGWDISGGNAAYTSTGTDTTLEQSTIALVEGFTYKVYIDVSNVTLDDPAAFYGIQLGGGTIFSLTQAHTYDQTDPLYLVCGGTVTDGLQISSSAFTTAGDTITLDDISVIVEQFKTSTNLNSLFFVGDILVPDGGGGEDTGPIDEYVWDGSTLENGERVYESVNSHPNGSGGSVKYFVWFNGSLWYVNVDPGDTGRGPTWESSGPLISGYTPFTASPQSIGSAAVRNGPVDHSTASGSAGMETDGISGSIELLTDYDFLNNLRAGKFGIVSILTTDDSRDGQDRYLSSETANDVGYSTRDSAGDFQFIFAGTSSLVKSFTFTDELSTNLTVINIATTDGWVYRNDDTQEDLAVDGLTASMSTLIRLGSAAYSESNFSKAKFGFTSILDFDAVTDTIDATWSTDLSIAINTAALASNYNAHAIAAAIFAYDNNISGVYYALNEVSSGDASDCYLLAYNIATQTAITQGVYGLTSTSGVTGTQLVPGGNSIYGPKRSILGPVRSIYTGTKTSIYGQFRSVFSN